MTLHHLTLSSEEIKALRQLLDLAVKHGGLGAVPAAMLFLQRLEMAERTPLPQPRVMPPSEPDSHGPHFPPKDAA